MTVQNLSIICASLSLTLLTACGGSGFSGALSPRKDGGSKKENTDATAPTVTTGAYLACDPRPADSVGADSEAVGCSVIQNGKAITPSDSNRLQFYRVVKDNGNSPPDKVGTSNLGYAAIFNVPKAQLAKTSFLAIFANKFGVDQVTCGPAPCRENITVGDIPQFAQLDASAVWRVDGDLSNPLWSVEQKAHSINPDYYYNKNTRSIDIGGSPGSKYLVGVSIPGVNFTPIQNIRQFYAPIASFKKDSARSGDPNYYKEGNNCIILPLMLTKSEIILDAFDPNSVKIERVGQKYFHLLMPLNDKNRKMVNDLVNSLN